MKLQNEIYLRRANKVIVRPSDSETTVNYLGAVLKNFETLGYGVTPELLQVLATLGDKKLTFWYKEIFPVLKKLKGADRDYEIMYPNFPQQVMELSESELYINAMLHYIGDMIGQRIMPDYNKEERFPLIGNFDLTLIDVGTGEDLFKLISNLIAAKTSISASDKEDVAVFLEQTADLSKLLPDAIPHKENLAFVTQAVMARKKAGETALLLNLYKTATDVLRLVTAMSDGDVSLAAKTRYRRFSRPERRLILQLLDNISSPLEDMGRHRSKWLRLNEKLHPQERSHQLQFPNAAKAFSKLCEGKVKGFNSQVEVMLSKDKYEEVANLLTQRPGDFARRLDHVMRNVPTGEAKKVLIKFGLVIDSVATPLLLQLRTHFATRNNKEGIRAVFPKGSIAKVQAIDFPTQNIAPEVLDLAVGLIDVTLQTRFATLPELGKVYVDPVLSQFLVPFSQRSASKALKTIVRGSRVALPDNANIVRFFLWWQDVQKPYHERVDVDMSVAFLKEDWTLVDQVTYYNTRSKVGTSVHSGDITSAPKGASEFIDVDLDSYNNVARYAVMTAHMYTSQPFVELPEAFAGWMVREDLQSGEVYDPRTVQNRFDLTSETRATVPMIVDMKEREVIWTDLTVKTEPHFPNNVESTKKGITLAAQAIATLKKPTLAELFTLHAQARGELVTSRAEADTIFSLEEGTTPFDIEEIMAEYL